MNHQWCIFCFHPKIRIPRSAIRNRPSGGTAIHFALANAPLSPTLRAGSQSRGLATQIHELYGLEEIFIMRASWILSAGKSNMCTSKSRTRMLPFLP